MEQISMNTKIGEIYICQVPFVDKPKKSKPRPVLVISEENSKGDISVIAGTSKEIEWKNEECLIFTPNDMIDYLLKDDTVFPITKQLLISKNMLKTRVGMLNSISLQKVLKALSFNQTKNYYKTIHKPLQNQQFIEEKSKVNYAGRVFDENEMINLIDSSLDFWLTYGKYSKEFEKNLAEFLGVRYSLLVNSGSSANLLAFYALTSPLLKNRQ